jgi:NAD-dependent DNA ligase
MKLTLGLYKSIQANPDSLDTYNENELAEIIKKANEYYYNKSKSLLTDATYDILVDKLKNINPENEILLEVGAPIKDEDIKKVELPYWMGSQDKIKTDSKVLNKWKQKYIGNYLLTIKLDGISALLEIKNGVYKLYTRGNGKHGTDISRMIKYIKNIPKNITEDIAVRGELIISKNSWENIKHLGSNPRNTVSGVFNSKKPNKEILQYIDFVTYQVLNPSNLKPTDQMDYLSHKDFQTCDYRKLNNLSVEILSTYLNDRKENCHYEIDGIVVYHNDIHDNITSGNPKYSFAFKNMMNDDSAEVTVTNIEWDVSKDGYLVPVVIFNPTNIGGVQVQRATGFNAKYIKDNKIGISSKLLVIRSGAVIPYIVRVIKASKEGLMPDLDYTWNESGVDIILNNKEDSSDLQIKVLVNFFTKMKTVGVSSGIVNKLYNAGFNTIYKILNISIEQLQSIDGFKIKSATNVYNALQNIDLSDCVAIMTASNTFGRGFGEKKIRLIAEAYPNLLTTQPTIQQLITLDSINTKTAENFLDCINNFKQFLVDNELSCNLINKKKSPIKLNNIQNLENIAVLFTGFRDKDMEKEIISRGGTIKSTLNKNVNILIIKDEETDNNKIPKARELEITILTKDQFNMEYLID